MRHQQPFTHQENNVLCSQTLVQQDFHAPGNSSCKFPQARFQHPSACTTKVILLACFPDPTPAAHSLIVRRQSIDDCPTVDRGRQVPVLVWSGVVWCGVASSGAACRRRMAAEESDMPSHRC